MEHGGPASVVRLAVATSCLMAGLVTPAWAGQVTTVLDGTGDGTLRHEVTNAASGETITFDPSVNIAIVTDGEIPITQDITLVGNGAAATSISGTDASRLFTFSLPGKTVRIEDVTIHDGRAAPGTNGNPGMPGGDGGAISFNAGTLELDSVELAGNQAGKGGNGSNGGAAGFGQNGNPGKNGGGGGNGGAIEVGGTGELVVANSTFSNNFAGAGGDGGNGSEPYLGANFGGDGGNAGAGGRGGAIYSHASASVLISGSTFTTNHSGAGGKGGNGGDGPFDGSGGDGGAGGEGGALYGGPTIGGSTFLTNDTGAGGNGGTGLLAGTGGSGGSGGAIFAGGPLVTNTTIVSNHTGGGGSGSTGGAGGSGGGVFALAGVINSATVTTNNAGEGGSPAGTGGIGGGVANAPGPGADVELQDSIVASNAVGLNVTDPNSNCSAAPDDGLHNLTFPGGTGCPGAVGDPKLIALASNGGPTQTMALGAGSAAIDQVPASGANCPATDQRGIPRPQGPACDIGAFEVFVPPTVTPTTTNTTTSNATGKKCKKKKKKHRSKKRCRKKR